MKKTKRQIQWDRDHGFPPDRGEEDFFQQFQKRNVVERPLKNNQLNNK